MGKTSIKNLVSLIMEGIITKDELNRLFPPGEFIFIDDLEKYPELFDNVVSVERGGQETPNYQDEPSFQDEPVRMAAESTELNEDDVKLATLDSSKGKYYDEIVDWVRISIEDITVGKKSTLPPIACIEPNTNELVEGIVIGNIMRVFAQSGMSALKFYNYGITDNGVDKSNLRTHYILYNGTVKEFYLHAVRQKKQGTTPERDVQSKLAAAGEDEKLATVKDASVKRYILFPTINQLFSEHKILDKLDISLIPETWATPVRTEHVSNVEKKHKFGGESSEIDTNFISGRDMIDVDTAMNDVMDLRMSLATGAPPAEGEEEQDREREVSKSIPRQHANYIYAGGNWPAKQRVHDKEFFKRAGEKTDIYKLLKKNIQEGNKRVNVTSVLDIKGNVQGDDYVMTSTFTATLMIGILNQVQVLNLAHYFQQFLFN